MPDITYIEWGGQRHVVSVEAGSSVMRGAVDNGVPGIDADCGGSCACATCHVYVGDGWPQLQVAASEGERNMLEFAQDVRPNSRLSCQIEVTAEMDGFTVDLPKSQS